MNISSFLIGYQAGQKVSGGTDVRYVTFMSEDGTVEYGKKAVAVGDDCADPIKRGVFSTPTKESTAQYNYHFAGWATEPNGGLNSDALKEVYEDRTVYANFASVLRSYTITFLDEDGSVLNADAWLYGSVPSYEPKPPAGYEFDTWIPALTEVTGNASYTAVWKELPSFATLTWTQIGEICAAGNAASTFSVGDTKELVLSDGKKFTVEIIGINHDTLSDGSGKAPLSICVKDGDLESYTYIFTKNVTTWENGGLRTKVREYFDLLPSDLKPLIKTVKKNTQCRTVMSDYSSVTSDETLFALSYGELVEKTSYVTDGPKYVYFATTNKPIRYKNGSPATYFIRTCVTANDYSSSMGANGEQISVTSGTRKDYVVFGFCI